MLDRLPTHDDEQAKRNRALFDQHSILAICLMSLPGSGKTTLLEATLARLKSRHRIAVVINDLNDAARTLAQGTIAKQITNGRVSKILNELDLANLDLLFIEQVGNPAYPASLDLGQHRNAALLSVTEGDDQPTQYPHLFRAADVVIISKVELLRFAEGFSLDRAEKHQRDLASSAMVIPLSAKSGLNLDEWLNWVETEVTLHKQRIQHGETMSPKRR